MSRDIIKSRWPQLAGKLRRKWNKLTEDDVNYLEGHREYLVGKLQERYGWQKDQAEREIREFEHSLTKKRAA